VLHVLFPSSCGMSCCRGCSVTDHYLPASYLDVIIRNTIF
jgi:hypothetical protein